MPTMNRQDESRATPRPTTPRPTPPRHQLRQPAPPEIPTQPGAPPARPDTPGPGQGLDHPAVGGALAATAELLGMEVVFIGGLTPDTFTFEQVHGAWPGVEPGGSMQRTDSLCHRLLAGAPAATSDAAHDPAYADSAARAHLGIRSYVGVPVRDSSGTVLATLCGIDHHEVVVGEHAVRVLGELAQVISAHWQPLADQGVVIRRTPDGWEVGGERDSELTSAMVLADLLTQELAPGSRPQRGADDLDELARLRLSVSQLEHALAARIVVEQALGVLSERHGLTPRESFERLRRVARGRGRKVHDLARDVVGSVTGPMDLPPELTARRAR